MAIIVVISVMYSVANAIGAVVKEKELRIKEGLQIMGLTSLAHTASWVFHFTCVFFFTTVFMLLASQSLFIYRRVTAVLCGRTRAEVTPYN